MKKWRFLDTGKLTAHENMALDEVLIEARSKDLIPNTIRLLQFSPPSVLVGYHQAVGHEVRTKYCQKNGIEINRRITGGGAIFLDESQIGWEVIVGKNDLGVMNREELSKRICEPIIDCLRKFGLRASYRPKNDIEIDGKKISGTGGTKHGGAIFFQGTLLVDFDVECMMRALKIPFEKLEHKEINSFKERVTCLKWELGYCPSLIEIKNAICGSFKDVFAVELEKEGLNDEEERLLLEKLNKFKSKAWIYRKKENPLEHRVLESSLKTRGGLIRVAIVFNFESKIIQSLSINGDFFAHPKRSIFDLEAALKFVHQDRVEAVILDFTKNSQATIPDTTPHDFVKVIKDALSKADIIEQGFSFSEANQIFCVRGTFKENLHKKMSAILLPYCAKSPDCELRYEKSCDECGQCEIGEVYGLAKENGMNPVTIISFEDLISTLKNMKSQGETAYLGSCCGQFYVKHREDFENAGMSGILVGLDRATCYDLGEEKEAYSGNFARQTDLDLELMKKLIEKAA